MHAQFLVLGFTFSIHASIADVCIYTGAVPKVHLCGYVLFVLIKGLNIYVRISHVHCICELMSVYIDCLLNLCLLKLLHQKKQNKHCQKGLS